MTKINRLGKNVSLVKIFKMNGEIFGAYKRSSARKYFESNNQIYTGIYQDAVYSDIEKAENNIIDHENQYV